MKTECPGCGEVVGVFWRPALKTARMYRHKARLLDKKDGQWIVIRGWCPGGGGLIEKPTMEDTTL